MTSVHAPSPTPVGPFVGPAAAVMVVLIDRRRRTWWLDDAPAWAPPQRGSGGAWGWVEPHQTQTDAVGTVAFERFGVYVPADRWMFAGTLATADVRVAVFGAWLDDAFVLHHRSADVHEWTWDDRAALGARGAAPDPDVARLVRALCPPAPAAA